MTTTGAAEQMSGTMSDKGAEYVEAWPASIARLTGRTEAEVRLVAEATYPGQPIGTYVTWQAKYVVRQVTALTAPSCHYCGLPLSGGKCRECV